MALGAHGLLGATLPYDSATVTLLENKVSIGSSQAGRTTQRPAVVRDVVTAKDFVLTDVEARAEMEFKDRTIVRVGQNTLFSFDADTRTLTLRQGTLLFYVPPHSGGGTIKTPTLTAAITGTIAKVSENLIAVIAGELTTKWGVVHAGEAIEWRNGEVRIFTFDPREATTGKLFYFGGPLPLDTLAGPFPLTFPNSPIPDLHVLDMLEATQLNPAVNHFESKPPNKTTKSEETVTPTPTARPTATATATATSTNTLTSNRSPLRTR